jgi:hypothetical protein
MPNERIDQVIWYRKRNSMVVTYCDGDPDRTTETQGAARNLAEAQGLIQVPSRQDVFRWVRHPESRHRTWGLGTSSRGRVPFPRGKRQAAFVSHLHNMHIALILTQAIANLRAHSESKLQNIES